MNPNPTEGRLVYGIDAATRHGIEQDWLFLALLLVTLAVLVLVFGLMLQYVIRYRASNPLERGKIATRTFGYEIAWTAATLIVFFGLFIWGADLYARIWDPPNDALKIYVVGKQWMWKFEHPGGQRELNALHIPVNRQVELMMTSEDVIHSMGIPAFRFKRDVLPGRYEAIAFTPIEVGEYHLFCDQFCGTDHSRMVGVVDVMSGPDYQKWLAINATAGGLAAEGRALFTRFGCGGCHNVGLGTGGGTVHAPPLAGLYGSPVPMTDGTVVVADDRYIRDCILNPGSVHVASYENLMPNFSGQLTEDDVIKLVAYIKSLATAR